MARLRLSTWKYMERTVNATTEIPGSEMHCAIVGQRNRVDGM
jgi:hypothetical protein